jgi:hypothetical protein
MANHLGTKILKKPIPTHLLYVRDVLEQFASVLL